MSSYQLLMDMACNKVPFKKIEVAGGHTGGRFRVQQGPEKKNAAVIRQRQGSGYACQYQRQDEAEKEFEDLPPAVPRRGKMMGAVEDLTSMGTHEDGTLVLDDDVLKVYDEYPFDTEGQTNLLIHDYKHTILSQIEGNSVVIIKGHTGCGKTTQVPQYILDDARSHRFHCNVVITQPRRIAAMSVAQRVCEERGWGMGSIVGYQIGLEKKTSKDTRLLYCTAGVLLQQLIVQQSLANYTHIVIDEIHERDSETDFLLIVIKKLMRMRGNRTKLILMSATLKADKFVHYFSKKVDNDFFEPPVIELLHQSRHHVDVFYLDSLKQLCKIKYDCFADSPGVNPGMYSTAEMLLNVFGTIDSQDHKNSHFWGSVLIFLPGINEIETMYSRLESIAMKRPKDKEQWILYRLHSTASFDEQKKVFIHSRSDSRKIILATNIAESSITVPDVKYVIDFCLTKHQVQDKDTFYSALQLAWVSKSQAIQRAGRVGRTMDGRVYRLIPQAVYEDFDDDCLPEILRCPLDQLVLKSKELNMGPPVSILGSAVDAPDLTNIQRTVLNLKEVGALTLKTGGEYVEEDGDLTFTGKVMASLPLDTQLSKLILVGHMVSMLRECVIMACCMSGRNIFASPLKDKLDVYNTKVALAEGSASDAMTYFRVYTLWKDKKEEGKFDRSGGEREEAWAKRLFVNIRSLREVNHLEIEVINRLERLGIRETKIPEVQGRDKFVLRSVLLKVALAGAFYPNYFVHHPIEEKEAVKVLGGRDPTKTVYFTKFPQNQPGPLYRDSIKELLKKCGTNIKVQFDGSAKVYAEFGRNFEEFGRLGNERRLAEAEESVPGRVLNAVYRAVKLRQLNIPMKIPMLSMQEANRRAKEIFGDSSNSEGLCWTNYTSRRPKKKTTILPGLTILHIRVRIVHIKDPHNFYIWLCDSVQGNTKIDWIHKEINCREEGVLMRLDPRAIVRDMQVLVPFNPDRVATYYRAKVLNVDAIRARVYYIDFGNIDTIEKSSILGYGPTLLKKGIQDEPPVCIHCRLAEVQPLAYQEQNATWGYEAIESFKKSLDSMVANAKIYSIVDDTMAVYLFPDRSDADPRFKLSNEASFNHILVSQGLAQFMEEPYLSKENHMLRERAVDNPDIYRGSTYSSIVQQQDYIDSLDFVSPTFQDTSNSCTLLGPKSPLEMSVSSITRKCIGKSVGVDINSVNSVLLDCNPMDTASKLIVAGCVTQNFQGERLTLRNTTIMPAIRGIVGMMCLIFAPTAELRVDQKRTFISGALCGLSCDENGISYDQENDIEVAFDCKFTLEDIETINKIRFWMNQVLCGTHLSAEEQLMSRESTIRSQDRIVALLWELFRKSKDRDPLCPSSFDNPYEWNQIPSEYLLNPQTGGSGDSNSHMIYPLIWGVELRETNSEAEIASLRSHLRKLDLYANGRETLRNALECELCKVYLDSSPAVTLHINTAIHKSREKHVLGQSTEVNNVGNYRMH